MFTGIHKLTIIGSVVAALGVLGAGIRDARAA